MDQQTNTLTITSLPEEVFLHILTFLPTMDLYNLCFVNSFFRKCATDYSLRLVFFSSYSNVLIKFYNFFQIYFSFWDDFQQLHTLILIDHFLF